MRKYTGQDINDYSLTAYVSNIDSIWVVDSIPDVTDDTIYTIVDAKGLYVDGVDTFALVDINYIRIANGIFIDRDYYKQALDSLQFMYSEKDTIINLYLNELLETNKKLKSQEEISALYKEESIDCNDKYNKLSSKYKTSKGFNRILVYVSGVAAVITAVFIFK